MRFFIHYHYIRFFIHYLIRSYYMRLFIDYFVCLYYIILFIDYYFIILIAIFVVLLDFVLDPLAVNENRWNWESSGIYYGVPLLNFFGWLLVPILVLLIFHQYSQPLIVKVDSHSALFRYFPAILFTALPVIASRPCFERGLRIPGYIGIILSKIYFLLGISKY